MALRNQDIGERIAQLRVAKGNPPQPVVADAVGVSLRALQLWEAGEAKPRYENLEALADYYGVSEEFILTGTEKVETPNPFRLSDQVEQVREEFREDVDELKARLTAIEAHLNATDKSIRAQLAVQDGLLADIRTLVEVLRGAQLEVSERDEARAREPWPDPDALADPPAPERHARTNGGQDRRVADRRRKTA